MIMEKGIKLRKRKLYRLTEITAWKHNEKQTKPKKHTSNPN